MNEITKYTDERGEAVEITFDDVKKYINPDADEKAIVMFLQLCQAQKLNPWRKDAYLVGYKDGRTGEYRPSMITAKEVFTRRANANPDYEGFEAGVTVFNNGKLVRREGSAVFEQFEQLAGGWAKVYVKGKKPFFEEVSLQEYSTGKSGWAKMPGTMIRKVALVHALREAFPDDFQGLYAAEEMGNAMEQDAPVYEAPRDLQTAQSEQAAVAVAVEIAEPEPAQDAEATDAQCIAITDLVDDFANMRGKTSAEVLKAVYATKTAEDAGIVEGRGFTAKQADIVIGLLQKWVGKATDAQAIDALNDIAGDGAVSDEAPEAAQYEAEELTF